MSKAIGHLLGMCGCWITITEEDLGFEEVECQRCGTLNYCPETLEEVETQNKESRQDLQTLHTATHVRILLKGEDGQESCLHNMVPKNEFLDLIVAGYQAQYTEGQRVWYEDEEATNAGLRNQLLRELDRM